jgi:hypothetical protein
MMSGAIDTGVKFRGHPVLLGPRAIDGILPDKLVLTSLDRFLRKHFPDLDYSVACGKPIVTGALPPKPKEDG